jgi:hypothetical protein
LEDVPRLPDEHLEKAKEMVSRHRTKKNCKSCYDRGYQGINQMNLLITCNKCVDADAVTEEWQAHVRNTPELTEAYGDYFESEEEEAEEEGGEGKAPVTPGPERGSSRDRHRPHGGSKPHRSVGR